MSHLEEALGKTRDTLKGEEMEDVSGEKDGRRWGDVVKHKELHFLFKAERQRAMNFQNLQNCCWVHATPRKVQHQAVIKVSPCFSIRY